jgi:hypothetical protein
VNLASLRDPFPARDIEWRVQSSGTKDGKVWAMVLAYVTNRAIMNRLDAVCGPENWRNQYQPGPAGGVVCGLSIKVGDEWVTKWDGAENTDIEEVKGGLSGAMKRAAVQWGIGRYLYDLDEGWARVHPNGKHSAKTKDGTWFKWDPPELPRWAVAAPAEYEHVGAELVHTPTGAVVENANKKIATEADVEKLRGVLNELIAPAFKKAMTPDDKAAASKAHRLAGKTDPLEGDVLEMYSRMVNLLARLSFPNDPVKQVEFADNMTLETV